MTRVVAVSGSFRDGSYTKAALHYALDAAAETGVETDYIDLSRVDLPLYDPDVDDADAGDAVELMERMRAADGVLLGSPVYHDSYSAAFRNFHDYCSFDEYANTVVGLLVVAGGGTIANALSDMRGTVRGVHGWTMPLQVGIRGARNYFEERTEPADPDELGSDSDYEFTDRALRERTFKLGYRLGVYADRAEAFIDIADEPDW